MWLVIELWPQPAHSVVAAPLYASRGRPMWLIVALMRGPRKIEDFVGPSCWDGLRFKDWFDDGVGRDGLAVVVTDRVQAAYEGRWQLEADEVEHLAVAVLFDNVHALVSRDELGDLRREGQCAYAQVIDGPLRRFERLSRLDDGRMRRPEGDEPYS